MSSCARGRQHSAAQQLALNAERTLRSTALRLCSTTFRSRCSRASVAGSAARASPCRSSAAFSERRRPLAATLSARSRTTSSSISSATRRSRGTRELHCTAGLSGDAWASRCRRPPKEARPWCARQQLIASTPVQCVLAALPLTFPSRGEEASCVNGTKSGCPPGARQRRQTQLLRLGGTLRPRRAGPARQPLHIVALPTSR